MKSIIMKLIDKGTKGVKFGTKTIVMTIASILLVPGAISIYGMAILVLLLFNLFGHDGMLDNQVRLKEIDLV